MCDNGSRDWYDARVRSKVKKGQGSLVRQQSRKRQKTLPPEPLGESLLCNSLTSDLEANKLCGTQLI